MSKHRITIPVLMALILVFLIPDLRHAISYNSSGSLIPAAIVGFIIGLAISYPCIRWVRRNQQEGKVRIGYGTMGVVVSGWLGITLIAWLAAGRLIPGFCALLMEIGPNDCIAAVPIFQASTELTWLISLYLWGIVFERGKGYRLKYHIPIFDYAQEKKRSRSK